MTTIDSYGKALVVLKKWDSMCPTKIFFRYSLDDFRKIVEASTKARDELAELEGLMKAALDRRDDADKITRRAVLRVVNGVKGDPSEGEDSELLAAMGYIPHTARSSIMSKARKLAKGAQSPDKEG